MSEVIPFGKYKGQPIEQLQCDKEYLEWLLKQSWFESRYANIRTIVINNFKEASETPEHNRCQAKFLNIDLIGKFVRHFYATTDFLEVDPDHSRLYTLLAMNGCTLERSDSDGPNGMRVVFIADGAKSYFERVVNSEYRLRGLKQFLWRNEEVEYGFHTVFEESGWDVVIRVKRSFGQEKAFSQYGNLHIELKTSICDEYPDILRKVKARSMIGFDTVRPRFKVVAYETFGAKGANVKQVTEMFSSSGIFLVDLTAIELIDSTQ